MMAKLNKKLMKLLLGPSLDTSLTLSRHLGRHLIKHLSNTWVLRLDTWLWYQIGTLYSKTP